MEVVRVFLMFCLMCVSASQGNEVQSGSMCGFAIEMLLTKLEYIQAKLENMQSTLKETDQKHLNAISQQSDVLQTQWKKDLESVEHKMSIGTNQLFTMARSIDQNLERMDEKINQQNQNVALLQTGVKRNRELLDEQLKGVSRSIIQLGQTMDHNFTSVQDQWKSDIIKRQDAIEQQWAGVSQAMNLLNKETGQKLNTIQIVSNNTAQSVIANHEHMSKTIQSLVSKKDLPAILIDSGLNLQSVSFPSCKKEPSKRSGKYLIKPTGDAAPFVGFCEQTAYGGGWLVFQYRFNGSVDFYRNWADYRNGFGSLDGEFWLGLEHLHRLTSENPHELLIELKDYTGTYKYARYDRFQIANESEQYALQTLGNYTGTVADGLEYHKDMKFSTKDQDNDRSDTSCAMYHKGAWWYSYCHKSNLNGLYKNSNTPDSIDWSPSGPSVSHAYTRMSIRET